ncbi:hypothetical protein BT96DRAFT_1021084 [Gymnopus androsaceus JB14]|uniref:Uncharacterized protein n=1 Tax=Gymnopus androsaceus JB14 TaxID=1447944 RepID=A0A6A4HID9_9AGAR|nr:hypothetical protein BT96DRAFT_1021084 [Gymnopus androsaceus JB14]
MNCPLTDEEIKEQCRTHLKKHPWLDDPEILVLKHNGQDTNFVVTFSRPYEAIVDRLLKDGFYGILVTEKLEGRTFREVMNGTPLSDKHADLIADTLQELRESVRPFENNKVTPLGQWTVQGHMFPDGETARVVDTVDEMASFLTERFRRAAGNEVPLPLSRMLLSNDRLAFVDFNQSCMGPRWWDWYALAVSCEDEGFVDPLMSALERKGLIFDEEEFGDVMDDLHRWYGLYGTVADIKEWEAKLKAAKASNSTSPETSFVTTQSRPHSPVSAPTLPPVAHDDGTSEEDDAPLTSELNNKELVDDEEKR